MEDLPNSPMRFHVGFLCETFSTEVAFVRFLSGVRTLMMLHRARVVGHVCALIAVKFIVGGIFLRLFRVHMSSSRMQEQQRQSFEKLFALTTSVNLKVENENLTHKVNCLELFKYLDYIQSISRPITLPIAFEAKFSLKSLYRTSYHIFSNVPMQN